MRVASVFAGVGGGLDERRAEGARRELQSVPRARRPDRGRARRARARARAARAGRGRPGDDRRGRARRARGSAACRRRRRRRSTRSRRTSCSSARSGPVLAESYLAVRRSEWAAYSEGGRGIRATGPLREVLSGSRSSTSTRTASCARTRHARRVPRALLREPRPAPVAACRDRPDLPARDPRARGPPRLRPHGAGGVRAPARDRPGRVRVFAAAGDGTERLLVDDGYPPAGPARAGTSSASSPAARRAPIMRIERVAERRRRRRAPRWRRPASEASPR